jgi:hypothetical protein
MKQFGDNQIITRVTNQIQNDLMANRLLQGLLIELHCHLFYY